MSGFAEKTVGGVLRHSTLVLTLCGAVTLLGLWAAPRIGNESSMDVFFDQKTENYIKYDELKAQFNSGDMIVATVTDEDIFTEKNLRLISDLTSRFEKIPSVRDATSLANVNDVVGDENSFVVERLMENAPTSAEGLKKLRSRALSNPLYRKGIVSTDGRTAAVVAELEQDVKGARREAAVVAAQRILKEECPPGTDAHLTGVPVIESYYDRFMTENLRIFLPLVLVAIIVVLYATFRRVMLVIPSLLVILMSLLWTTLWQYLLGFKMHAVMTIIPPVILAVAVSDSVHLVSRIARKAGDAERGQLIRETFVELMFPCFLTSITTFFGFMSLVVSRSPAIRQLGLVAGPGVMLAYVITFTFLPAFLKHGLRRKTLDSVSAGTGRPALPWLDDFIGWMARMNMTRRWWILGASLAVSVVSLWGGVKVRAETSMLEQFHTSSLIYRDTRHVESRLCGTEVGHVSLKAGSEDAFKEPENLRVIEKIQEFLKTIPEVDRSTSVLDYLKEMNQSFHNEEEKYYAVPESRQLTAQYVLLYGNEDLDDVVDPRWRWALVNMAVSAHSSLRQEEIGRTIREYLAVNVPGHLQADVLGPIVTNAEGCNTVVTGQVQSLVLAMVTVMGIMFLALRSLSVGTVSVWPNLFPLLINFGIMGLTSIPLDTGTAIIAAVAIGLIVDNTIHYLHAFGERIHETGDYRETMRKTMLATGRPMLFSALILFCGFGVLMFSRFVPVFYFGLLSAILMMTGLLGDLFVLPCLVDWLKPKFKKGGH